MRYDFNYNWGVMWHMEACDLIKSLDYFLQKRALYVVAFVKSSTRSNWYFFYPKRILSVVSTRGL
jgi:hypothetical protein